MFLIILWLTLCIFVRTSDSCIQYRIEYRIYNFWPKFNPQQSNQGPVTTYEQLVMNPMNHSTGMDLIKPYIDKQLSFVLLAENGKYISLPNVMETKLQILDPKFLGDTDTFFGATIQDEKYIRLKSLSNERFWSVVHYFDGDENGDVHWIEAVKYSPEVDDKWCDFEPLDFNGKLVLKQRVNGLFVCAVNREGRYYLEAACDHIDESCMFSIETP